MSARRERPLIVFPGALGDLILFVPALRAIAARFPGPPVVLAKRSLAPLIAAGRLGEPAPIEGPPGAWLFSAEPPSEAAGHFGSFAAVECFTGFGVPEVARNLDRWVGEAGRVHRFRPPVARHLALHFLESIDAASDSLPELRIAIEGEAPAAARAALATGAALVLHPGSGGREKRWSKHGFAEVGARWAKRRGPVVVVLGPAEAGEADEWSARGFVVVERPELPALAALFAGSRAASGNDSGTSHLAAAAGAAGIVLFGPTDERLWRPLSRRLRVVRPEPWARLEARASEESIRIVDRALAALDAPPSA